MFTPSPLCLNIFRWPNYIVKLPRYFSFRLPHLNINTGPPSDELDKNIQRKSHFLFFSQWNGYNHFRSGLNWFRKFKKRCFKNQMSVIWSWTYFYNLHWNNYLYFKGLLYIWEEMIMMALLHMAGLENSECIWKIQRKPEVAVSVSLTKIFNKPDSLTQLYRYTPEIFLFSTATFKYIYRAPSDKLDKNSQRMWLIKNFSPWNGYNHFRSGLNWFRK